MCESANENLNYYLFLGQRAAWPPSTNHSVLWSINYRFQEFRSSSY